MNLLNITVALFLIMDSVGNVGPFLSLVEKVPPKRQKWILIREMLIALAVMILFNYIGEFIFSALDVSQTTLRLTSGIILFLVALKILFPSEDSLRANLSQGEPFITPFAIPLIAGPSVLATIMLFAQLDNSGYMVLLAILIAWVVSLGVLLASPVLKKFLGSNGLSACERLMGMILVLLSVQRFLEGFKEFLSLCK